MASEDEASVPAAKFRCNRKKEVLTVCVALHHVSISQIDLHTSETRIKVSTKGRRKWRLDRAYPNGMKCDDTQTAARMEGNILIVEMPITHLPLLVPGSRPQPQDEEPAAAAPAEKPKAKKGKKGKALEVEAEPSRPSKKARAAVAPEADQAESKPKKQKKQAAASTAGPPAVEDVVAPADDAPKRKKKQPAAKPGAVLELIDEAANRQAEKCSEGLAKMRRFEAVEADRQEKVKERKVVKEDKNQEILEAMRQKKKGDKRARKEVAVTAAKAAAAKPSNKKKRVSFGEDVARR